MRSKPISSLLRSAFLSFLLILASAPASAHAEEFYQFMYRKQTEKAKTRWSLQEWLDTRDRMRLMDLWLALHSPSPYEFYIGGDYRSARAGGVTNADFGVHGAAYASIFGLEGARRFGDAAETRAHFHLRIFGFHAQATNITLQAGVRSRDAQGAAPTFRNASAGVSSTIYLGRYFGIDGLYRHHFESVATASGRRPVGSETEAGAFIDFKVLRVFGTWFSEAEGSERSSGFRMGTRLYF